MDYYGIGDFVEGGGGGGVLGFRLFVWDRFFLYKCE